MQYIYYSRSLISKARPEDISTSPYTHFKPKVYIGVRIILRQILTKKKHCWQQKFFVEEERKVINYIAKQDFSIYKPHIF